MPGAAANPLVLAPSVAVTRGEFVGTAAPADGITASPSLHGCGVISLGIACPAGAGAAAGSFGFVPSLSVKLS